MKGDRSSEAVSRVSAACQRIQLLLRDHEAKSELRQYELRQRFNDATADYLEAEADQASPTVRAYWKEQVSIARAALAEEVYDLKRTQQRLRQAMKLAENRHTT